MDDQPVTACFIRAVHSLGGDMNAFIIFKTDMRPFYRSHASYKLHMHSIPISCTCFIKMHVQFIETHV